MSDKEAQEAFEKWFEHEWYDEESSKAAWFAGVAWERERPIGCMVDPTSKDEQIEKLQAQLTECAANYWKKCEQLAEALPLIETAMNNYIAEGNIDVSDYEAYLEKYKGGE